jgi:hypothetical protein
LNLLLRMMDRPGRYGVDMISLTDVVGSRVTSVKSPMYGMMAAGLGNPTDVPSKASTKRSKTWSSKPQLSMETLTESMTHLV